MARAQQQMLEGTEEVQRAQHDLHRAQAAEARGADNDEEVATAMTDMMASLQSVSTAKSEMARLRAVAVAPNVAEPAQTPTARAMIPAPPPGAPGRWNPHHR